MIGCLLIVAGGLAYQVVELRVQLRLANEQVKIFDSMRLKAIAASPKEAAECLQYVQNYYPSGSRLVTGSQLDEVVESLRASVMREILCELRSRTAVDVGAAPSKRVDFLSIDPPTAN
jgi:hypothetical protein